MVSSSYKEASSSGVDLFAHSVAGSATAAWERLGDHLQTVACRAGKAAEVFGYEGAATIAGLLHDIGKASGEFQAYIRGDGPSPDHSTAGALESVRFYPGPPGKLLAFGIAGHHAGLADGEDLERRFERARLLPDYARWRSVIDLPLASTLAPARPLRPSMHKALKGFEAAFLTRMLFSCLIDADFVATEAFYAGARGETVERGDFTPIPTLTDRLQAHLARIRRDDTDLNRLRSLVLDHATAKAELAPGLFTLTVPTGGGKTLTSLSFALEHARRHGLRRVVYVIPFTSIIEQTAEVFREALGDRDVLEHHASFDWEAALPRNVHPSEADAGEGSDGLDKLRRAAENWDAPVVVTTAVQFFESLFANRTSRCRKLHNLAKSVVVLDEAQTLPLPLLHPCLAALDELARNYGASVVLCTATQPAVRVQDGFKAGLDIPPERELAPEPAALYAKLKRVRVERRPGRTEDAEVASRFDEMAQMLVVVNSRAHAADLFARIRDLPGAAHLSTLMCPRHRRIVLAGLRERLKASAPVRLVSTSLIEAGVDIDFPEVWRATTGLDQIIQASGRANREGRLKGLGRVVVFEPADHPPPHSLKTAQQEAEGVLARHPDPMTLEAVRDYFQNLYWSRGEASFDDARLEKQPFPILRKIAERAPSLDFPFESIARAFRMIDQAMEPVIVPWDDDACAIIARVRSSDRPRRDDLRRLQQYVVPIPPKLRLQWCAEGALQAVHPQLGEALLAFPDLALYDPDTGVRLDPHHRSAESNVM